MRSGRGCGTSGTWVAPTAASARWARAATVGASKIPDAEVRAEGGVEPRDRPGGDQRVATEVEEPVGGADPVEADELGIDTGDRLLDGSARRDELATIDVDGRRGQRTTVQLAAGVQRHRLEYDERRGHHVGRQTPGERLTQRRGVHVVADDVGHQLIPGVGIVVDHDDGLRHLRLVQQRSLDLTELDPQTTQLHLEIGTPDIDQFQPTRGGFDPLHQITGAIHPLPVAERAGDEAIGRQIRATHIPTRQLHTTQVELTGHTDRHRMQTIIKHLHPRVPHRRTNRNVDHVSGAVLVERHIHRCLGRTVQIVQRRITERHEGLRGLRGQRLTRTEHLPQRRHPTRLHHRGERREHRRHEMRRRHRLGLDEIRHIQRITVTIRPRNHQRGTNLQRPEQLPHRHIERHRRLLHHHVRGGQRILRLHPLQTVHDALVRHRHPFGRPVEPDVKIT